MKQSRGRAILGSAVLAGAIGIAGFAFTASNTVPDSKAGDGAGAVSGYTVSNVHYGLNSTDPTSADSVTFTLNGTVADGSTFKAQLVDGGTWYSCTAATASGTTTGTCTTTGQAVLPMDTLHIVIAQ
jgi:hypothetical protein